MRSLPPPLPSQRIVPGPGQESVWDYPRPPRVEASSERVTVRFGGRVVVDTTDAVRVLETSHPPVYYLPRAAFAPGTLVEGGGASRCEFKGDARYVDLRAGSAGAAHAGWYYPEPWPGYEALAGRVALYPGATEGCEVDGEPVTPQVGGFYGGWITARVVGPFKGAPGTLGW
ncbi:DUF427 domain-containing protein [Pengzhenrongella sicca]|uniref:DUF427 domain-containing protein n=1 Tax=Pengzhenrongella sicca TaxID=2819238 RepID=A0A8A4Z8G0_9MICO|nr:DUF427 domain-containing protein [Pengzhenrongella sicca]QTE28200.1 DUF427 domain-containing protein [Pengzhenrongella sicca]